MARFPAPFFGVLPDLFVAGDDTHEAHTPAPSVATRAVDVDEDDVPDRGGGRQGRVFCRLPQTEDEHQCRLWIASPSSLNAIPTPALVWSMVIFAVAAVASALLFVFAYLTQLYYGNDNRKWAVRWHTGTYILLLVIVVLFLAGIACAAHGFLGYRMPFPAIFQ